MSIINDIVKGRIKNGEVTNVIHSFTPAVEPGFKIVKELHTRSSYFPLITKVIDKMTTRLVDENGKTLRLSGVTIIFQIREVKNTLHCAECSICNNHRYEKITAANLAKAKEQNDLQRMRKVMK